MNLLKKYTFLSGILVFLATAGATNSFAVVNPPTLIKAVGYERHLEFNISVTQAYSGYNLYRKTTGDWEKVTKLNYGNLFLHYWKTPESAETAWYALKGIDGGGNESVLSDSVQLSFKVMTDDEYLDMVQEATFRYFWDYAHPTSGLARERYNSGNTVTTGGSGFGIMTIPVAVERGWITRAEGAARVKKMVQFLYGANKFHGAWPHWINGSTGDVIPFGTKDNGGDLVETAFMIQGLLTVKQYFNGTASDEVFSRTLIDLLWKGVEWDWYLRYAGGKVLYWHWSPNYGWDMNFQLKGWNETMITYLLAIASPTHPIPADSYTKGWASASYYKNGKSFYGYKIDVGWDYGGPLFFAHYSFLGFDPRDRKDAYTNYFTNNRNVSMIHNLYSAANPKKFKGYSINSWGLTASDDPTGYRVHEPNNDNGTISPTAALSSTPYTPSQSIKAIKHFYSTYQDSVWGQYGFYDAFNPSQKWFATSYLAIDQGPIVVMIENYRTQLLWNLFMKNTEIQPMLTAIGMVPTDVMDDHRDEMTFLMDPAYPNPFNGSVSVPFHAPAGSKVQVDIINLLGQTVRTLGVVSESGNEGLVNWDGNNQSGKPVSSGLYFIRFQTGTGIQTQKVIFQK